MEPNERVMFAFADWRSLYDEWGDELEAARHSGLVPWDEMHEAISIRANNYAIELFNSLGMTLITEDVYRPVFERMQATWYEGFLIGCMYTKNKGDEVDEQH